MTSTLSMKSTNSVSNLASLLYSVLREMSVLTLMIVHYELRVIGDAKEMAIDPVLKELSDWKQCAPMKKIQDTSMGFPRIIYYSLTNSFSESLISIHSSQAFKPS